VANGAFSQPGPWRPAAGARLARTLGVKVNQSFMPSDAVLYHYCSSQAFASIVAARSIWLSSLSLSNDSSEGRLVAETLLRLARRDKLASGHTRELEDSLAFTLRMFDGLAFCLSEAGDLLSQWRGYADDGRGLAIGFQRSFLELSAQTSKGKGTAGFSLYKVEYDDIGHESRVEPTYRELLQLIEAGAFQRRGLRSLLDNRSPEEIAKDDRSIETAHTALLYKLLELIPTIYELKSPAFREEREWRLVSMHIPNGEEACMYRAESGRVIPYRATGLDTQDGSAIAEVVLGPRHTTPPAIVQSMLKQYGFTRTVVKQSSASYR
jgi:hypothetical protein